MSHKLIDAARRLIDSARRIGPDQFAVPEATLRALRHCVRGVSVSLRIRSCVRATDPDTSHTAAADAVEFQHPTATNAVVELMQDGKGRIDQDMWRWCRKRGIKMSLSSIQHGRLKCQDMGWLRDSGRRRKTRFNRPSIVWVKTETMPTELHLGKE